MRTYQIDPVTCDGSPHCPARRVCPKNAIVPVSPKGYYRGAVKYTVDESQCAGCGMCARVCPTGAVTVS
ncbi:MAG: 4Fe-4S binding protein [Actinomycetia bacterium]|nr:4Fe-4S binding protein [Actinomycetes bacterium]